MDISGLTPEQKSVLLAKAMGWTIHESVEALHIPLLIILPEGYSIDYTNNLYEPIAMAVAWRVLNWAIKQMPIETKPEGMIQYTWAARLHHFWSESHWTDGGKHWLFSMTPADAQRLWLDKILKLAIEAGIIDLAAAPD
jgi:hypothetical protein